MKIIIFGLCLFITSEIASATSCGVFSEEQKVALSEEYRSFVKFEYLWQKSEVDVSIQFPKKIRDQGFTTITLIKGDIKNLKLDFMMPISANEEKGEMIARYMINSSLAKDNVVQIVYGKPCGLVIDYEVSYKQDKG